MGLVYFGIPPQLVAAARQRLGLRAFVETGTFRGDTAALAGRQFERVYTVEFVEERFRQAQQRFAGQPQITCLQGNSPDALRKIAPELKGIPTMFWLDAHWNGDTESRQYECPVIEEVRAINEAELDAYIMVDDARYFIAPPPSPHDPDQWPSLDQLMPVLTRGDRRYVVIVDDMIIAWPRATKPFLVEYARTRPMAWSPQPQPGAGGGGIYFVPQRELPPRTIGR